MFDLRNRCLRAAFAAAVALPALVLADAASAGAVTQVAADPADSSTASGVSAGASESMSPGTSILDGLYFRAGILVDRPKDTRFLDVDCSSTSPAALYGCGQGVDGMPLSAVGDFSTTSGFELGIGRVATSPLRLEAVLSHRSDLSFAGHANFHQLRPTDRQEVSADLNVLSGMLVAYVDLSEPVLPYFTSLRPFVGAGAGLSHIDIDETHMEFPRTRTVVPGGQRTNVSWMLAAGIALPLGEGPILDVAWRYTDHGDIETGRGTGRVEWRDGGRAPLDIDLAKTRAELRGHGFAISLRYPF